MAYAIFTSFHGATGQRGSRIGATNGERSTFVGYDHAGNEYDAHRKAAAALCDRMGWRGELVSNTVLKSGREAGRVFVWISKDDRPESVIIDGRAYQMSAKKG